VLRTRRYRVEVRAWRMTRADPADLVYVTYRVQDDRWVPVRDEEIPRRVAWERTALLRLVRLTTSPEDARFEEGATIDRTSASPVLESPLT